MIRAVFIEPSAQLAYVLQRRKAAVRQLWPDARYLEHPLHSTLVAGAFGPSELWLDALRTALRSSGMFEIHTSGTVVFENDPATGGSTVAIEIAESPELRRLQSVVAGVLAPSRDIAAATALADRMDDPVAAASARAFGSAWVGPHWRPHFTIASLPVERAAIPPGLLENVPATTVDVPSVAVWDIDGEVHMQVATVPIGFAGVTEP